MSWHSTTGPAGDDSFRSVLEDPDFTRPVTWREGTTTQQDGSTVYEFGDPVEMELFVGRPDADRIEQLPHGPDEDVQYVLGAFLDRGITQDDRISFDDGVGGSSPYRVGAPEVVDFDGDRFAWYALTDDDRGDGSSDDSGSDGDYPVR